MANRNQLRAELKQKRKAEIEALRDISRGPRMAGDERAQLILKELKQWKDRTRGETYGYDFWVGKNAESYALEAESLKKEILANLGTKPEKRAIRAKLEKKFGYGTNQAKQEITCDSPLATQTLPKNLPQMKNQNNMMSHGSDLKFAVFP